ncbi:hypothetical protein [Tardiphaga sp. P9-11]|uniref:hypothetical protein n=1 Tax=Tardiphaga sp. P9-11 TaxID=2024614 RepID=UPI0011F3D13B|nr:hypothetical protein [Tardiphaga sp. P9-11]KAA0078527.1 hypothetical protein CIW50_05975 [Tardiphaga sp. P9-11]
MKRLLVNLFVGWILFVFSNASAFSSELEEQCGKTDDFNVCILAAVDLIHGSREGQGYSDAYFTKDLDYGPAANAIEASNKKPNTMCVAAVSETLITALNIYYNNTKDTKPFDDLPAARWNGWSARDIRDYMWENRGSHSAGYAFDKFGIGQKLDFPDLRPGDFLSFDRGNNSGHSVIFISYLDKEYNELKNFSSEVAGFKYYSSQGSGVAGFAYRWAFFTGSDGKGVCSSPDTHPSKFRDCFGGGVQKHYVANRGGRVNMPQKWHVKESSEQLVATLEAVLTPVIEQQFATQLGNVADLVSKNFSFGLTKKFDIGKGSGPIASLPGILKDKKDFQDLATSSSKQRELVQSPAIKGDILKAVQAEIDRQVPGRLDPKFLKEE